MPQFTGPLTPRSRIRKFSRNWRRRPDLNRGSRFCRPLPYHLATAPTRCELSGFYWVACHPKFAEATGPPPHRAATLRRTAFAWNQSEGWSGKRDSNPRLRPWQGRTLPLSYSRSLRKSSVTQRYLRDQEHEGGPEGPPLRSRVPQDLSRLFGRGRIQVEPCRPLESGHLRQLRNDLDVPVIELVRRLDDRGSVDQQVVRRRTE